MAFQKARGPWQQQALATYRETALTWLTWLEDVALPANQTCTRRKRRSNRPECAWSR